jgi:four helix bundle protein
MIMNEQQFKDRMRLFALRVIRLVESLPQSQSSNTLGRQSLRSATSVGANYRADCRGKSTADVIAKLSIVEEESDECLSLMELLIGAEIVHKSRLQSLMIECDEILSMTVASIKTLRRKQGNALGEEQIESICDEVE